MKPTDQQALAWLDRHAENDRFGAAWEESAGHARAIKAMLAEPRMPETPTGSALIAMRQAMNSTANRNCSEVELAYRALYAHLSKPRTKTIWRVEWDVRGEHKVFELDTLDIAVPNYKAAKNNVHHTNARLSGPHEVSE